MKQVVEKEFNFLVGDHVSDQDRDLFFGPLGPDDVFMVMPDRITFPEILKIAGIFPSTSAARKNGWGTQQEATFKNFPRRLSQLVDEPGLWIPEGFTDFFSGKGKVTRITVLKITLDIHG